jgi:lysophospholipase L1-like esterase
VRARRFGREVLVHLAVFTAVLLAAELILRTVDLRELRDSYEPGRALLFRHDAELGWAPIPNASATFTGTRTVTVHNNSLGLRDVELVPRTRSSHRNCRESGCELRVQSGTRNIGFASVLRFRSSHRNVLQARANFGIGTLAAARKPTVLFVGDSFVWGYDVEAGERFTELLRAKLPAARIVNAGVPGYGTDQEYLLLARIWSAINPDVVVLMFCTGNDRADNSANMRNGGYYKPYLARAGDGTWHFVGQPVPWSRHVYFHENALVRNLWLARAAATGFVQLAHPEIAVPDPTERLVTMMRAMVESRGAKFLVGLQYHEALLEAFLRARGIPSIAFDGAPTYPSDGFHWTPEGHAVVAQRLMPLLAAAGIDTN